MFPSLRLKRFQLHPDGKFRLKGRDFMNAAKNVCFWVSFSFIIMAVANAHAAPVTVTYTLDNVILVDDEQITGTFYWTYSVGDFEGGSGEFTSLEIPYTPHSLGDPDLTTEIQTTSIEITGVGDFHDAGLDISLKFSAFTPTQSASIDLGLSSFDCCGNGFHKQDFQSGSISPTIVPEPSVSFLSGLAVFGFVARRRRHCFGRTVSAALFRPHWELAAESLTSAGRQHRCSEAQRGSCSRLHRLQRLTLFRNLHR
jgi:hypothetical protein